MPNIEQNLMPIVRKGQFAFPWSAPYCKHNVSPFNRGTWPKRWIPPSESTPRLASHGGLTPFFGPNSNYLFDRQHKNLPIADLPGPSRLDDAFDSFPNSILRHNDFNFILGGNSSEEYSLPR